MVALIAELVNNAGGFAPLVSASTARAARVQVLTYKSAANVSSLMLLLSTRLLIWKQLLQPSVWRRVDARAADREYFNSALSKSVQWRLRRRDRSALVGKSRLRIMVHNSSRSCWKPLEGMADACAGLFKELAGVGAGLRFCA